MPTKSSNTLLINIKKYCMISVHCDSWNNLFPIFEWFGEIVGLKPIIAITSRDKIA